MDKEYAKYLLEKTRNDYNLIAEDFSMTRGSIWPETKSLFDKYFFPGEKVLDLGCGNGRYFEYLKEKKVNYFGVDNSEKLIEIAKARYPEADFQVTDALNLPFSDNFFDKVISIAVFHHIPSEELRISFLNEAKRILKPEGFLILTVWNWWDFRDLEGIFLIFKHAILKLFGKSKLDFKDVFDPWAEKTDLYYHCFTKKELKNLVKKVDFRIREVGILKRPRKKESNIFLIAQK